MASQDEKVAIQNWLADEVSPAVAQFANDDRFVHAANWPLNILVDGSGNLLRRRIAKLTNICASLNADFSVKSSAPFELPVSGGVEVAEKKKCSGSDQSSYLIDVLEQELVDPNDYWNPIHTTCPKQMELLGVTPLSDRVTRAFLARAEFSIESLNDYQGSIHCENQANEDSVASQIDTAKATAVEIRRCCLARLNGFDEACIILTQVYAAFARFVDLHWMAAGELGEQQEVLLAKEVLDPIVDMDAMDRIVWALSTVSNSLEELPDPDVAVENAVPLFNLVVDLSAKTIFWKGEQFEKQLSPGSWELFSVLLEARTLWNRPVGPLDLDSRNGNLKKLKVQKQRLVDSLGKQFPDLADAVVSDEKSYFLSIDQRQIVLFSRTLIERIYLLCGES